MNNNLLGYDTSDRAITELISNDSLLRPGEDLTGAINRLAHETRVAGSRQWTSIKTLLDDLRQYHPPSYEHCLRVGIYTHSLSVNWEGCDDPAFALIAGVAHDIGKLKIPLRILRTQESLSESDRSVMDQHAMLGFDMLKDIDLPVAAVAGFHHKFLPAGFREIACGINMDETLSKLSQAMEDRTIAMAKLVTLVDNFDARMVRKNVLVSFQSDYDRLQAIENDFHEDDARLQWLFDHRMTSSASQLQTPVAQSL